MKCELGFRKRLAGLALLLFVHGDPSAAEPVPESPSIPASGRPAPETAPVPHYESTLGESGRPKLRSPGMDAKLDQYDRRKLSALLEKGATGVPQLWRNPESTTQFALVPMRTSGNFSIPCREFKLSSYQEGRRNEVAGRACRRPDGTWTVEESRD